MQFSLEVASVRTFTTLRFFITLHAITKSNNMQRSKQWHSTGPEPVCGKLRHLPQPFFCDSRVVVSCSHHEHSKHLRRKLNHAHCFSHNFYLPMNLALLLLLLGLLWLIAPAIDRLVIIDYGSTWCTITPVVYRAKLHRLPEKYFRGTLFFWVNFTLRIVGKKRKYRKTSKAAKNVRATRYMCSHLR